MTTPKWVLLTWVSFCAVLAVQAQTEKESPFISGPKAVNLGEVSKVEVPAGYVFLDGDNTRKMMTARGQPTSGQELGFLSPTNSDWAVFFEFSDIGYVKDDEKLDPAKMLEDIKKGNEYGNKIRQQAGNPPLVIVGWEQEPKYNSETHNLEWAIRATVEGRPVLNYKTAILGRKGVMDIVLVCDPQDLQSILPEFRSVLARHSFVAGESYAEYKPGDKLARYGLAALVVGGATVGAAKLGLLAWLGVALKKFWKFIVIGVVAVGAAIKKLFGGNKSV